MNTKLLFLLLAKVFAKAYVSVHTPLALKEELRDGGVLNV
jgi:hypothetical protein